MNNIIETKHLNFCYNRKSVLTDLNLEVPKGCIYGYLGKNGAGKSTTLKVILGLLRFPPETVFLFEQSFEHNRIAILKRIGSFIESPSLYYELTCKENLQYLAILFKKSSARIDHILDLVGLSKEKNKKVKYFSTGMKQRLSIAMALFHDPELLLLDEPINGLDPSGVYDIRELLLRLQNDGKTIFLSSHILSEVEKLCTHIGIIDHGKLLYQGSTENLLKHAIRKVMIRLNDVKKSMFLCQLQGIQAFSSDINHLQISINNDAEYYQIIKAFIENNIEVYNIDSMTQNLESIFISLTNADHEK